MANLAVQGIMKRIKIYLGLGSNLGDRLAYLEDGCQVIEAKAGRIVSRSTIYETLAYGNTNQPNFLNQVIEIESDHSPEFLLHTLKQIENGFDRVRKEHWGPRTFDIDILFYGNEIIEHSNLIIPHPDIVNRLFVLIPMNEIAPNFIHPSEDQSIEQLLIKIPNKGEIWPYNRE